MALRAMFKASGLSSYLREEENMTAVLTTYSRENQDGFLARNTTLLSAKYHLDLGPSHPFPTPNV